LPTGFINHGGRHGVGLKPEHFTAVRKVFVPGNIKMFAFETVNGLGGHKFLGNL
jgi:hypothetical protein